MPVGGTGHATALTGASGGMSTVAMVACCAHHVTDVLSILGLTAAAAFLAEYRLAFMFLGLGMTLMGIMVMVAILMKERQRAMQMLAIAPEVI